MEIHEEDMAVRIRLAQLRFVFLNLWLSRLLHWIQPFQEEAAVAAVQAQQLASEKAAETAQSVRKMLEENPQRIKLDVELYAPEIVVPRKSTSHQVLLVNLGRLIVDNNFTSIHKATIDNMVVTLKDVHAATGLLDKDSVKVSTQCNILKPLTFSLQVHRNLAFQSHKDVPEITVDAHLSFIDLSLSQQDYSVIMQTLSGNLSEGKPPPPPKKPANVVPKTEKPPSDERKQSRAQRHLSVASPRLYERATSYVHEEGGITMGKPQKDHQRIVFNFKMDDIDMRLYEGNSGFEVNK